MEQQVVMKKLTAKQVAMLDIAKEVKSGNYPRNYTVKNKLIKAIFCNDTV